MLSRPRLFVDKLLMIAGKHKLAVTTAALGFYLGSVLAAIASAWIRTSIFPSRLKFLQPMRFDPSMLALVTVKGVSQIGDWEYELPVVDAVTLIAPSVMFGLYLSVLIAILRSSSLGKPGMGRRLFLVRKDATGQPGLIASALTFLGNILGTSVCLTPPCIGVLTTVSILGLLGFGAGLIILPYFYLAGSMVMLISLSFLIRRVEPEERKA